jgi:hypothetical protein
VHISVFVARDAAVRFHFHDVDRALRVQFHFAHNGLQ